MKLKISGDMTVTEYFDFLNRFFTKHEIAGKTLSTPVLFMSFRNEDGELTDFYDEEGNSLEFNLLKLSSLDKQVIELIDEGVRNKDIAIQVGIPANKVSSIKQKYKNSVGYF